MNINQIDILFEKLGLGQLITTPTALAGGFLHRMYAVQTIKGKFVVKAINPDIMKRPTAMQNFLNSELIANRAKAYLPSLPALSFDGTSIQQVDGQYYLIFDWVDGKIVKPNEITTKHCEEMGRILSILHNVDFSDLGIVNNTSTDKLIDWDLYLKKGQENNAVWTSVLDENIVLLKASNAEAISSISYLVTESVITHGDLDPKNVLWDIEPILIDWESAGYRNPKQDLIETALYWSEDVTGEIDKVKFLSFIRGYNLSKQEHIDANWSMIMANGYIAKMNWLEYGLKRSLWIDCTDKDEQQAGTNQVEGSILAIKRYAEKRVEIEGWLNEI